MVRLELDQVVMRRMKEADVEVVKALIKVCTDRPLFILIPEMLFLIFVSFCLNFHQCLSRRAVRAWKTVSSFTSSHGHSAFSSWLFSPPSCDALSIPLS